MKKMCLVIFFLASMVFAESPQKMFREIHRNTWKAGGVCRHAAATVIMKARKMGLVAHATAWQSLKNPILWNDPVSGPVMVHRMRHTIPSVLIDGKWHHFETLGGKKRFDGSAYSVAGKKIENCNDAKRYSGSRCIEFDGIVDEERLGEWMQEVADNWPHLVEVDSE